MYLVWFIGLHQELDSHNPQDESAELGPASCGAVAVEMKHEDRECMLTGTLGGAENSTNNFSAFWRN